MTSTLYSRILKEKFERLPKVLQQFHGHPSRRAARGRLDVIRGCGWFRNILSALLRFPPAGQDVDVQLTVTVAGERELWCRNFDGHKMNSGQWEQDGLLIEAVGPMRIGFEMSADDRGMEFKIRNCWFLLIPIPRWLYPKIGPSGFIVDLIEFSD